MAERILNTDDVEYYDNSIIINLNIAMEKEWTREGGEFVQTPNDAAGSHHLSFPS